METVKDTTLYIVRGKEIPQIIEDALKANLNLRVFNLPWAPDKGEPILEVKTTRYNGRPYHAIMLPNKIALEVRAVISHIKVQDIYGYWYPLFTRYKDRYISNWFNNHNQVNCIAITDPICIRPGNFYLELDSEDLYYGDIVYQISRDLFDKFYIDLVQRPGSIEVNLEQNIIYSVLSTVLE